MTESTERDRIALPAPTVWPMVLALGVTLGFAGLVLGLLIGSALVALAIRQAPARVARQVGGQAATVVVRVASAGRVDRPEAVGPPRFHRLQHVFLRRPRLPRDFLDRG